MQGDGARGTRARTVGTLSAEGAEEEEAGRKHARIRTHSYSDEGGVCSCALGAGRGRLPVGLYFFPLLILA